MRNEKRERNPSSLIYLFIYLFIPSYPRYVSPTLYYY
jgi:hypothetical protein